MRACFAPLATILLVSPALAQTAAPAAGPAATARQPSQLEQVGLTPPTIMSEGHVLRAEDIMIRDLLDTPVYTGSATDNVVMGRIVDLVASPIGDISAAVVAISGFPGVPDKTVAVDFSTLIRSQAEDGTWQWSLETTTEALLAAPEFGSAPGAPPPSAPAAPQTDPEQAPQQDPGPEFFGVESPTGSMEFTPDARTEPAVAEPLAEELPGMGVYGVDDQPIGTIGTIISDGQGGIDALVVDVGGFLGLGARPIAIAYENLTFWNDVTGAPYLHLNATRAQLENQPQYDPETYAAQRNQQRLVVGR